VSGNGYVWPFGADHVRHLDTPGAHDMARLNRFVRSIPWWRLVPDRLGTVGALVVAGAGTIDSGDHVAAAATTAGDLLVAYIGPEHRGAFVLDMRRLRGMVSARWFDPTAGRCLDSGHFTNAGCRAFRPPGRNAAGDADWVLRLDSP
jgi:Putative collagen-binding domain of a collagenase